MLVWEFQNRLKLGNFNESLAQMLANSMEKIRRGEKFGKENHICKGTKQYRDTNPPINANNHFPHLISDMMTFKPCR